MTFKEEIAVIINKYNLKYFDQIKIKITDSAKPVVLRFISSLQKLSDRPEKELKTIIATFFINSSKVITFSELCIDLKRILSNAYSISVEEVNEQLPISQGISDLDRFTGVLNCRLTGQLSLYKQRLEYIHSWPTHTLPDIALTIKLKTVLADSSSYNDRFLFMHHKSLGESYAFLCRKLKELLKGSPDELVTISDFVSFYLNHIIKNSNITRLTLVEKLGSILRETLKIKPNEDIETLLQAGNNDYIREMNDLRLKS